MLFALIMMKSVEISIIHISNGSPAVLTADHRWQHCGLRGNNRSRSDWSALAQTSPSLLRASLRPVWACVQQNAPDKKNKKVVATVPAAPSPTLADRNRALRAEEKNKVKSKPQKECFHFCDHLLFQTPSTIKTSSLISLMFPVLKRGCAWSLAYEGCFHCVAKEEWCEMKNK